MEYGATVMSVFTRLFNRLGGYDQLAARYPCPSEPQGLRYDRQSVEFGGAMRYKWCTTVILAPEGLYVQARPPGQGVQPAIFVPWADIVRVDPVRLYWRKAARATCGTPLVGSITVWQAVWEAASGLWAARQAPPPPPPARPS